MAAAWLAACRASNNSSSKSPAEAPAATAQAQALKGLEIVGRQYLANAPDFSLEPKSGGVFRYGFNADPPHLDPVLTSSYAMHAAVTPVYNRLMRGKWAQELNPFNPWKVEVTDDLAQSHEVADPQTYTFKLHQGVKFHNLPPVNGRELTAEDVKYSFERFAKTGVWTESFKVVDRIDTPDKYTVTIKLKEPAAYFLTSPLAENAILIHSRELVEADGDLKKRAIGTGPFTLKEFTPKTRIIWEKNPAYFRTGRPYLDRMEWTIITDLAALLAAYRSGQFDAVAGGIQRNELDGLLKTNPESVVAISDPNFSTFQWAFRMDQPPFNDVRVRRAFSMAFDRQVMIRSGVQGDGQVMTNFPFNEVLDKQPAAADFGPWYQYNPGEAKKLLEAAGYPNGFECPADYYVYATYLTSWIQIAEQQLAPLGIKLKINAPEYTTWVERFLGGKYEMSALGFASPNVVEMDSWTYLYMHSKSPKNAWHINEPKVDTLVEAQRRELDRNKRRAIWKELWDMELDQVYRPSVPAARGIGYHSPKVHNVLSNQAHLYPTYGNAMSEIVWLG
ncbi:MAG: ABC transporter substrate-binding protein [Chloroflexi bacterium]|nr:ABC transporter substrate-binding protein [Chloroflexota bacterium]